MKVTISKTEDLNLVMMAYYKKTAWFAIDQELRNRIMEIADNLVDQIMEKYELNQVITRKVMGNREKIIVCVELKRKIK